MKNFYKNNPPRFWFIVGAILVSLLTISSLVYCFYFAPKYTGFRVGEKKFTKADIDREIEIAKIKAKYMDDPALSSADNVKAAMIEAELLELMAKDNNISVTDTEIDAKISKTMGVYSDEKLGVSEEDVYATYLSAYGYDKTLLRKKVRLNLLKDKIIEALVIKKEGRVVYTRFNSGNGVEDIVNLPSEKLDEWAKSKIDEFKSYLDKNGFDALYLLASDTAKYIPPSSGASEISLNTITVAEMDEKEKKLLGSLKLKTPSEIIKSDATYSIYYIDSQNNGRYNTWEDLLNEYKKKYVAFSGSISREHSIARGLLPIIFKSLGIQTIQAGSCANCSGCVGSSMSGYVTDYLLGEAISGATVTYGSTHTFCGGATGPNAYCGTKSKSYTTASNGFYVFNRRDGSSCFANCAGNPFTLRGSKTGFSSAAYTKNPINGRSYSQNIVLIPTLNSSCSLNVSTITVNPGEQFTATMSVTNTSAIRWLASAGFKIGSQNPQDNTLWGINRVEMSTPVVDPGQTAIFTINAKAPNTPGEYAFSWQTLKEGYSWFGSACTQNIIVRVTPPTNLTCTVTPVSGSSPLSVKVEPVGGVGPYIFNMGDGRPEITKSGVFYYTYSTAGTKAIAGRDSQSPTPFTCSANVNVSATNNGTGGEVAP